MQQPMKARVGYFASATVLLLSFNSGVFAQQPAGAEAEKKPSLEEITVTGSRIKRDDFSSAQPTTVIDNQYLENLGIINLGQAMVGIPQNVNRTSPDANAGNNFFNGSTLANLRGLNPFFGTRTLTLVDSRRHVPTNQGDGVDLNFIPTILIDRVETVTGGASASYGSGAIGGVQNILLNRKLEGIKAQIDYGATSASDGESTHFGFAFGTKVGENGNFVVGIEGEDSKGIFKCSEARDWCGQNVGTISNWRVPPGVNPQNIVTAGVQEAWNSRSGIFWLPSGPAGSPRVPNSGTVVPGVQLNATGNGLVNFNPGIGGDAFFGTNAIGGEGEGLYQDAVLRSPVKRNIGYASFTKDIGEHLGFFVEASMGNAKTDTEGGFTNVTYTCIRPDNAYIQPSQQGGSSALLNFVTANQFAFPCVFGGVPFSKNWENQINHGNVTDTDLTRVAFGFNGQFGDSSWSWDTYYQYGKSERMQLVRDLVHENMYNYAIDSVLNAQGQPACRSAVDPTVTTPAAVANVTNLFGRQLANPALRIGCVPINPFGTAPIPAAAKAYSFGFIRENTDVTQNMAEFVASGEIAKGFGAGPFRAAAGVSIRSEELDNIAAEELGDAIRRDFAIQYGESFAGTVDVTEEFAEFDLPWFKKWSTNAAVRHSDYTNTAGFGTPNPGAKYDYSIDTWKISNQFEIVPAFKVRLSKSHDIRAPNQRELYYGQVFTPGSFFGFIQPPFSSNPWTNSMNADPVTSILYGGARNNVKPEEADTATFGVIIQPTNSNVRLGLDYFDIKLKNAITPANLSITIQGCFAGIPSYCDKITNGITTPWRDPALDHFGQPTGGLNSIPCPVKCFVDIENYYAETFNAGEYDVQGLDITFDWSKQLAKGMFNVRMIGTRTFKQDVTLVRTPFASTPATDIVGTLGSTVGFLSDYASAPDFAANVITTWSRGNFSITGQMRYVDDGKNARDRIGPDDARYSSIINGQSLAPPGFQTISNNYVGAYRVFTATGMYNFQLSSGNRMQLWASINNLFDDTPPIYGGGTTGGANPIFYDTAGREYRLGLRMDF